MSGAVRSIKDATKQLQVHFNGKPPLSLPTESRRMLQHVVEEYAAKADEEEASKSNQELRIFWERHVADSPQNIAAFAGVLRELRPALTGDESIWKWYTSVIKPVISGVGYRRPAVEDAQEFLMGVMIYDEEERNARARERMSVRICNDLLGIYLVRTKGLTEEDAFVAADNAHIAQQVDHVLTAFGRKNPRQLFLALDGLVVDPETRIQGLTLLSSFLRHQAPHLYRVLQTPLVEHLLICLMNDTSTTVLSVALTSLIMLLPHIPASLASSLPRLFLIYSRLLCWEKFSPLSTEAQRNLVTDDRIAIDPEFDHGDVGIDPTWQKVRPKTGLVEATTPEVMTYFTYLYGLYPLNFVSYIRKPRRYLKNVEFPGADDFDLDQAVIRGRSDQFRQVHLLHPNFYNLTLEEELADPKWSRMDPADVVAECHGLSVNARSSSLTSPGPPPSSKLPEVPPVPPIPGLLSGTLSPTMSHASLRSGTSWKDTATAVSADPESPVLGPRSGHSDDELNVDASRPRSKASMAGNRISPSIDEFPGVPTSKKDLPIPSTNLAYLQREITLLRNDLNFERWHKAQYSQHIGQLMRKNVKDATAEAETLNLINANRALKQQLEQVRNAREATLKDSALTRKQVNNLETNMSERFSKLKKEQETWVADADELRRLRAEMKQYRDLQSAAEARELSQAHQLEIMKRDMESWHRLNQSLTEAQRKIRELEFREFDFEQAKREVELLTSEKETLLLRVKRHEEDRERMRRVHADRVAELEAQMAAQPSSHRSGSHGPASPEAQAAIAEAQSKLAQLKKAHSRLLDKYTDLELEYSSVKSQLEALQGVDTQTYRSVSRHNSFVLPNHQPNYLNDSMSGAVQASTSPIGVLESVYDAQSDYGTPIDALVHTSTSDPTSRRYAHQSQALPISPPGSDATIHAGPGLSWNKHRRTSSRDGGILGFNKTAPLGADEMSIADSRNSGDAKKASKPKIQPNSEVRVFGRGGAQNIKMKDKQRDSKDRSDKSSNADKPPSKTSGLRALAKGLV